MNIFCRECIKDQHTDEKCFVVDLYEIEKMRKLQRSNTMYNRNQLKKRKDGANEQCVVYDIEFNPQKKKKEKVGENHKNNYNTNEVRGRQGKP